MLVEEAVKSWFGKRKRGWTAVHAAQVWRLCLGWIAVWGGKDVRDVTLSDVEAHEMVRDNGSRSGSALNQERVYLRQFFRWCVLNKWREEDPTTTWEFRSTVVKRKYADLSREQQEALLKVCDGWLKRFVLVAIYTGLREGTIRQLHSDMIKGNRLVVPASIMKARNELVLPILPKLREALGEVKGPLFPDMPPATAVWRAFKAAAWRAGLSPDVSPHDLRRTWVSRLTEAGVPTHTIMALGGWKTPGVLIKHYASRVPEKAALDALSTI